MIPHSQSTLGEQEQAAISAVLSRNCVGYGPVTRDLELAFTSRTGRKYGFAVHSGFHALLLALRVLKLPIGSRVAVPVLTCRSVVEAVLANGHMPVLCDIRRDDLTIDVRQIPRSVRAVIAPHAYGAAIDGSEIETLGMPWIEDCATSPATTMGGRPAGSLGSAAIFSFASTKYITGGLGGLVVFDDQDMAAAAEIELDDCRPNLATNGVPSPRLRGRLCDLNSAVALVQLGRIDAFLGARRAIAETYRTILADRKGITLPVDATGHSYYRFICRVEGDAGAYAAALRAVGIDGRESVNPWLCDEYETTAARAAELYCGVDYWRGHLLSLPIYPTLDQLEAERIASVLRQLLT